MNIRITDLLDDYFDDTVKLTPPEALEAGDFAPTPEPPSNKTSRLYKPLLVAATLMLVLSGAVALGLGFQRDGASGPGGALAEGNIGAFSITDSSEILMDSAQNFPEESPVPVPAQLSQICTQYCQSGSILSAVYELSPVPPEYISEELPTISSATDSLTPAMLPLQILESSSTADISVCQVCYWPATQTLAILINARLDTPADVLDFTMEIPATDEFSPAITASVTVPIPCPELNGYATQANGSSGGLHTIYDQESLASASPVTLGTLTRLEVSSDQLYLTVEARSHDDLWLAQGYDDETIAQFLGEFASECINAAASELEDGTIEFEMTDGSLVTLDYDHNSPLPEATVELSTDENPTIIEMVFPLGDTPLDSTQISTVHYHDPVTPPEITTERYELTGTLTATLDLPFYLDGEEGILNSLAINLSTRTYTWRKTIPQLEQSLYEVSTAGTFTFGDPDSAYHDLYSRWEDTYWNTYFANGVSLVFTDGTTVIIGSGEQVTFSKGYFIEFYTLPSNERDSNYVDTINLIPDYVVINGQNYYFQ